jgi:hypothetical protein
MLFRFGIAIFAVAATGCGGRVEVDPQFALEGVGAEQGVVAGTAGTGGTGGTEGKPSGVAGSSGTLGVGGAGAGGYVNEPPYPDPTGDCEDYHDPTLEALLPGGLPACLSDDGRRGCGLNVDALDPLFPGMEGCLGLGQPSGSDVGRCEGLSMISDVGENQLFPCCRLDGTCGLLVSMEELGAQLGFPFEPADFGCVAPLPFVAKVPVERVPEFWSTTKAWPEEGAPLCVE